MNLHLSIPCEPTLGLRTTTWSQVLGLGCKIYATNTSVLLIQVQVMMKSIRWKDRSEFQCVFRELHIYVAFRGSTLCPRNWFANSSRFRYIHSNIQHHSLAQCSNQASHSTGERVRIKPTHCVDSDTWAIWIRIYDYIMSQICEHYIGLGNRFFHPHTTTDYLS